MLYREVIQIEYFSLLGQFHFANFIIEKTGMFESLCSLSPLTWLVTQPVLGCRSSY